jgi:hypothetical protein
LAFDTGGFDQRPFHECPIGHRWERTK